MLVTKKLKCGESAAPLPAVALALIEPACPAAPAMPSLPEPEALDADEVEPALPVLGRPTLAEFPALPLVGTPTLAGFPAPPVLGRPTLAEVPALALLAPVPPAVEPAAEPDCAGVAAFLCSEQPRTDTNRAKRNALGG
ncbi:MAG TPA: hypothetical protein VFG30_11080 [Polyangiales bacterium]|nr:hypothetical protein [Polyangiales bacterium]